MSQGLLINGKIIEVPGVIVDNVTTANWAMLHQRDYKKRTEAWIRQIMLHTTKGEWPQTIVPGIGPSGRDKRVADFWAGDPVQSAAHLVVDSDGTAACLADLKLDETFHATSANRYSIGIEIYQEAGGKIYQAAIDTTVILVDFICSHFLIPRQIPTAYRNRPLKRFADGGSNLVGVFGHRDQTHRRGRGDPGDEIMASLAAADYRRFDFDAGEDLAYWRDKQTKMGLVADGIPGPRTMRHFAR